MGCLFAGQEDSDFTAIGVGQSVDTTAGHFRSGYAREALGITTTTGLNYWRATWPLSSGSFWQTARVFVVDGISGLFPVTMWRWFDASGIVRLRLRATSGGTFAGDTFVFEKLDASGTATQLGSSFGIPATGGVLIKFDVQVVYAVSGSIAFYLNSNTSAPLFSFSGDVTTNSVTSLSGSDHGPPNGGNFGNTFWSEIIAHTSPTLSMSLAYGSPVANGNTHNFTSAAASNVNPTTMNLTTPDYSNTTGQIDQYTVNAIPAGSFSVRAVVVGGTAQKGSSGPSHLDWGVRRGGADYWSPDIAGQFAPTPSQYIWDIDPSTGLPWQTADVGNAAGFNIGARSVV